MTNEFLAFAPISAAADAVIVDPAVALLDEMMARVGVDGIAASLADPGLLAMVDQHSAAVRDALVEAELPLSSQSLAAYAKSIVFAARRAGRPVPAAGRAPVRCADWMVADWHLLRLVAVCTIADDYHLL
jgi:uncharacterized protein DUF6401